MADQQSHDDLFTGRALCGDAGQHLQAYLQAMGIVSHYLILRVLPVNGLDVDQAVVMTAVTDPQTVTVYQAIVDKVRAQGDGPSLLLTFGSLSKGLVDALEIDGLPHIELKAWTDDNALADWQSKLSDIEQIDYAREIAGASFQYDGARGQIPRFDLPFGYLLWQGSSGSRGVQAIDRDDDTLSPNYFKFFMPKWAADLDPAPLSKSEQDAIESAP